jgi:hypothetical protein
MSSVKGKFFLRSGLVSDTQGCNSGSRVILEDQSGQIDLERVEDWRTHHNKSGHHRQQGGEKAPSRGASRGPPTMGHNRY